MDHYFSGVHIDHREQQRIFLCPMYMHILNVHTQVFQRFRRNDLPEPYELPGYDYLADSSVEQEMLHFH
jgi:hypothetical protein